MSVIHFSVCTCLNLRRGFQGISVLIHVYNVVHIKFTFKTTQALIMKQHSSGDERGPVTIRQVTQNGYVIVRDKHFTCKLKCL